MRKAVSWTVLALAAMLAPAMAEARSCRADFYESANAPILTGRYQDVAKDAAALSWEAWVLVSLGPYYANWKNAEDQSFRCTLQGGRHRCTARARPCSGPR